MGKETPHLPKECSPTKYRGEKGFLPDNTMHQGKHCDQVEIQVHPTVTLKKKGGKYMNHTVVHEAIE